MIALFKLPSGWICLQLEGPSGSQSREPHSRWVQEFAQYSICTWGLIACQVPCTGLYIGLCMSCKKNLRCHLTSESSCSSVLDCDSFQWWAGGWWPAESWQMAGEVATCIVKIFSLCSQSGLLPTQPLYGANIYHSSTHLDLIRCTVNCHFHFYLILLSWVCFLNLLVGRIWYQGRLTHSFTYLFIQSTTVYWTSTLCQLCYRYGNE